MDEIKSNLASLFCQMPTTNSLNIIDQLQFAKATINDQIVCRTCLTLLQENVEFSYMDGGNARIQNIGSIIELVQFCVPEMDLYVSARPVICYQCLQTVVQLYNFKTKCIHSENSIRSYLTRNRYNQSLPVDLHNVLIDEIPISYRERQETMVFNCPPANIPLIKQETDRIDSCDNCPETKSETDDQMEVDNDVVNAKTPEINRNAVVVLKDVLKTLPLSNEQKNGNFVENDKFVIKIDLCRLRKMNIDFTKFKKKTPNLNASQSPASRQTTTPTTIPTPNNTEQLPNTQLATNSNLYATTYTCNICLFSSNNINTMYSHNRICNYTNYYCDYCKYTTTNKEHLDRHMTSKHSNQSGNRTELNVNCESCSCTETAGSNRCHCHCSVHTPRGAHPLVRSRSTVCICDDRCHSAQCRLNSYGCVHRPKPLACQYCIFRCISPYQFRCHQRQKHALVTVEEEPLHDTVVMSE